MMTALAILFLLAVLAAGLWAVCYMGFAYAMVSGLFAGMGNVLSILLEIVSGLFSENS